MKPMHREILLIRHARTRFNQEGRIQGRLDSPLTEVGENQSLLLGEFLGRQLDHLDSIYTSPQPRALHTTELILKGSTRKDFPEPEKDVRLMEVRCGTLEGKTREEMDPDLLHRLRTDPSVRYPGGESLNDLMVRGKDFLRDLEKKYPARPGENCRILIVSHGHFNRALAAVLTGLDGFFSLKILQDNTGFSRFQGPHPSGAYRMASWNETPHLQQQSYFPPTHIL